MSPTTVLLGTTLTRTNQTTQTTETLGFKPFTIIYIGIKNISNFAGVLHIYCPYLTIVYSARRPANPQYFFMSTKMPFGSNFSVSKTLFEEIGVSTWHCQYGFLLFLTQMRVVDCSPPCHNKIFVVLINSCSDVGDYKYLAAKKH